MTGELLFYSFLTMALTQIIKRWIQPRWGTLGVHAFVLAIAIIIAVAQWYSQFIPSQVLEAIFAIYALAVGWYEILVKRVVGDVIVGKILWRKK